VSTAADITTAIEACEQLDSLLTIIGNVRAEKPRDPLRRLEDVLLDLRAGIVQAVQ
jgi:hypothetical protein